MRQIEELMTWETWLAREPAIDRPRGEWLTWLESERRVTTDPFSLIEDREREQDRVE